MLSSLLLLAIAAPAANVTKVVVYPDRAQVTRSTSITCQPRASIRFEALPPAADPASLRASTAGGTIEGLRYEEVPHSEAFSKPIRELETQIRELLAKRRDLADSLARSRWSAGLAGRYSEGALQSIDREMTAGPPMNTAAWQSALDLALTTRLKAAQDDVATETQIRALEDQIDDRRRALNRMREGAQRRELVAEVLVDCPVGTRAQVELTYFVGGAGWEPAYEARADEAGGAVDLAAYATVQQRTGEPWTHAAIVLSTAVPLQQATPPEIQPLKVWAEEREPERKVLVRRDEHRDHAEAGPMSPPADSTPVATPAPAPQTKLAAQNQGLSVQLTVPEPADVAGDGTPARLFVGSTRLGAKFALRAAPSVLPFAFRVADLVNAAPFPLLAGPVDTFGKSGFIGRYPIERVAVGAPFHLTFGAEDALRIKRVVLEEVQRDTGLFNGNHRFRYGYRFEVANDTTANREVELLEHYPVSELDDVKVEVDPQTMPGFENRAGDGILVWKLRLDKGQKREVELHFHVDVPSSYDLAGL